METVRSDDGPSWALPGETAWVSGRDRKLADLVRADGVKLVVQDRYADSGQRFSHGAGLHRMAHAVADDELIFRDAVMLVKFRADAPFPFGIGGFAECFTRGMGAAQAAKIMLLFKIGSGQQAAINRSDRVKHRYSVSFYGGKYVCWCGAIMEHSAGDAVAQREKQVVTEGADEAPFAGGQHDIVRFRR